MSTVTTNQFKNGNHIEVEGTVFKILEFQHVKPGKGGAFVRTKLKNVRTGAVIDRTFRADEKVVLATIDRREMQFLYREGPDYVFMDNESYDQLHVGAGDLGQAVLYLKEGDTATLPVYQGQVIDCSVQPRLFLVAPEFSPLFQCATRQITGLQINCLKYHALALSGGAGIFFENVLGSGGPDGH